MLIKKPDDFQPSEITEKSVYLSRREFIKAASLVSLAAGSGFGVGYGLFNPEQTHAGPKLTDVKKNVLALADKETSYKDVTTYNNFYEFGTDKHSPAERAGILKTRPWTVAVDGECKRPKVYDIEELLKLAPLEERIYRLRCVEGWSMVVPWVGYSLSELINRVEPTGKAKYVEFTTLYDPGQMPGQRSSVLKWPYVEGLRLDEAMHPLAILCMGL
jgi:methionine sulfoxide reductase catalytic subunit